MLLFLALGGNDDKLWRWRKVDIMFIVGIAVIVYGVLKLRIEIGILGAGIAGIPLTQRGDKP